MAKRFNSRSPSHTPHRLRQRARLSPGRYEDLPGGPDSSQEDPTYVPHQQLIQNSEDEETEEGSRETALRRSNARALRRNEPLRQTASYPKRHF